MRQFMHWVAQIVMLFYLLIPLKNCVGICKTIFSSDPRKDLQGNTQSVLLRFLTSSHRCRLSVLLTAKHHVLVPPPRTRSEP